MSPILHPKICSTHADFFKTQLRDRQNNIGRLALKLGYILEHELNTNLGEGKVKFEEGKEKFEEGKGKLGEGKEKLGEG